MKSVKNFYNKSGWVVKNNYSKDAKLFEDLRSYAKEYVSKCRLRVLEHIPIKGGQNILDFASGPIQYKEYLKYSEKFKKRYCVDFSKDAIQEAKKKLGSKGSYYCNDILNINFKKNYFDAIICIHTLYHVNKLDQKKVVKKLLKIAKKGAPIIIIYSNPNTILNRVKRIFAKNNKKQFIYFFCHPNDWWSQFNKEASLKIVPWRSFSSQHQKILFPNNSLGKVMLRILFLFEDKFKNFFSKNFQYPMIILKKK